MANMTTTGATTTATDTTSSISSNTKTSVYNDEKNKMRMTTERINARRTTERKKDLNTKQQHETEKDFNEFILRKNNYGSNTNEIGINSHANNKEGSLSPEEDGQQEKQQKQQQQQQNNDNGTNANDNETKSDADDGHQERTHFIGWSLLPSLFRVWDLDNSGSIDREELLLGVNEYCKLKDITTFTEEECIDLMNRVDLNHDQELDCREFGYFLSQFSIAVQANLDDVVYFMMEILENQKLGRIKNIEQRERQQQLGGPLYDSNSYLYLMGGMMQRALSLSSPSLLSSVYSSSSFSSSLQSSPRTPHNSIVLSSDIKVFDNTPTTPVGDQIYAHHEHYQKDGAGFILEDFNIRRRVSKHERREQFQQKTQSFTM